MKKIFFILFLSGAFMQGHAQKDNPFRAVRYDENYAYLKNDSSNSWYKKAKYTPLSKTGNTYISFGGDIRYQYFNIKNEDWGDAAKDKDGYLYSRLLLHADLHAGTHFRSFVQLQGSMVNGKAATSPVEEDPLELHQAFIDWSININKKNKLVARFGRQEFYYGSQRLVAVRDGPNNRQSFDGLKTMFMAPAFKADLFYSHYVKATKGLFDDSFNKDAKLWGAYLVKNKVPVLENIDLYYLGLWKRKALFDDGAGAELRHSIGSRVWRNNGSFKYDVEGVYQFGSFGEKDISAWTFSVNVSQKLDAIKLKPELALKTEVISGDASYGDNKLQSFDPLFPRGGYFGLASLIGPANLFDVHPGITLDLARTLHFNVDYDLFWRYSINDGIYTPGVALIYTGKNNPYRFIGGQLSPDLTYTPNNFLYFRGEFTWFSTGSFLKSAGRGKDIFFTGITAQLKF